MSSLVVLDTTNDPSAQAGTTTSTTPSSQPASATASAKNATTTTTTTTATTTKAAAPPPAATRPYAATSQAERLFSSNAKCRRTRTVSLPARCRDLHDNDHDADVYFLDGGMGDHNDAFVGGRVATTHTKHTKRHGTPPPATTPTAASRGIWADYTQQKQHQHHGPDLRKAWSLSSLSPSPHHPVFVFPAMTWQKVTPASASSPPPDHPRQRQLSQQQQYLQQHGLSPEQLLRRKAKAPCLKRAYSAPQLHDFFAHAAVKSGRTGTTLSSPRPVAAKAITKSASATSSPVSAPSFSPSPSSSSSSSSSPPSTASTSPESLAKRGTQWDVATAMAALRALDRTRVDAKADGGIGSPSLASPPVPPSPASPPSTPVHTEEEDDALHHANATEGGNAAARAAAPNDDGHNTSTAKSAVSATSGATSAVSKAAQASTSRSPTSPLALSKHVAEAIGTLPPDHLARREVKRYSTELIQPPHLADQMWQVTPRRDRRASRLKWRDSTGRKLCSSMYFWKEEPPNACSSNGLIPNPMESSDDDDSDEEDEEDDGEDGCNGDCGDDADDDDDVDLDLTDDFDLDPALSLSPSRPPPPASSLTPEGTLRSCLKKTPRTNRVRANISSNTAAQRLEAQMLASPPSSPVTSARPRAASSSQTTTSLSNVRAPARTRQPALPASWMQRQQQQQPGGGGGGGGGNDTYRPSKTTFSFADVGALPHTRVAMLHALSRKYVQLEDLTTHTPYLFFIVRVLNLAFEKSVIIRYTTDGWRSHHDVHADYLPGSSDPSSDRFYANLSFPTAPGSGCIEFAIRYLTDGKEFWDNNDGHNYKVTVTRVPFMRFGGYSPSSPSPSNSSSPSPPASRKSSRSNSTSYI
ncbi:hypothetical protein PTSG_08284 [Salpingoeca rosetta]|uniref:CBM21 domain-containing protein n=1 Tax=Salpingoeca rosetta (strain ATCC 50818 / BSB-021) TaxID=946362 RepID=F2UJ92_SALR5|nr:uncharacterized protein PTSG_08284 [Salpingoeca rosetta]EGD77191.1 hypothetical protein PTSG_08284 [Salpingoeca rosetta]|eukprot:XP_004990535.1 hypothetical protein PTSG_08284 [Salpingoeca rosetta]